MPFHTLPSPTSYKYPIPFHFRPRRPHLTIVHSHRPQPPPSPPTPVEPPETPEDYDKLIARERKKLAQILHARDRYLAKHELLMDACQKTKMDATAASTTTKAALSQRETKVPSTPPHRAGAPR